MKSKQLAALLKILTALLLGACVTVNVNFPESAVQKATDDYVRDLYRAKEKKSAPVPLTPSAGTAPKSSGLSLIANAYAEMNFKVSGATAEQIREKLAAQLDEVMTQKRAGVLGENNKGLLTLQAPEKLKPLLLKKLEKTVADENKYREQLYSEVLRSNSLEKARLIDIQKSFARSFQAESPSGTWLQDSDGGWAQKP